MEQLTEDYISFETAKLAKEKNFAWTQFYPATGTTIIDAKSDDGYTCYNEEGFFIRPKIYNTKNPHYPRPTQALLSKWLRKFHNMNVWVDCSKDKKYIFTINFIDKGDYIQSDDKEYEGERNWWDTHEEALDKGLFEALKLINNEQKKG